MTSRIRSIVLGIAAVCLALGGAPAVSAAPNAPGDALCEFTYPTPDDFDVAASSATFAVAAGPGTVDLIMLTDAASQVSYQQTFAVTWANLDTGRNGQGEVAAEVQGSDNVLTIPGVRTEPGRIAFVLKATNHGSDQNYTYGDCSAEYSVG
ncbi:hypothetical protein [Nocardia paucivorans]|uniref:hypothetical protein n=1 Tax=Nocardia paucivorans TaxID=114259 RepID=UPI000308736E|nr:hypothetical protein [Nocardia paucivorans]